MIREQFIDVERPCCLNLNNKLMRMHVPSTVFSSYSPVGHAHCRAARGRTCNIFKPSANIRDIELHSNDRIEADFAVQGPLIRR